MTRSTSSLLVFACFIFASVSVRAGSPLSVAKDAHLWLEGDSTLHKYKLDASKFTLEFVTADAAGDAAQIVTTNGVKSFDFRVRVADLTSGDKGLDDNMRKALLAEANPEITFRMQSYQTTAVTGGTFTAHLKGILAIAGTQHLSELDVQGTPSANGVHFVGEKRVLMSSYGVKPPVLMLGTIKTADAVVVKFDFTVAQ